MAVQTCAGPNMAEHWITAPSFITAMPDCAVPASRARTPCETHGAKSAQWHLFTTYCHKMAHIVDANTFQIIHAQSRAQAGHQHPPYHRLETESTQQDQRSCMLPHQVDLLYGSPTRVPDTRNISISLQQTLGNSPCCERRTHWLAHWG
jgi:hypothetical protein